MAKGGRPPVIFPGNIYGIFKVLRRIENNRYLVRCANCDTVFERHIKSVTDIQQTKRCLHCRNSYNKRLYQRWKHFIDNVPKHEIDETFLTYKGWESWVLSQSNYSEEEGRIYFYRIGALHKFEPGNCAFSKTKVNLRHHMDTTSTHTYLVDHQREAFKTEDEEGYWEY